MNIKKWLFLITSICILSSCNKTIKFTEFLNTQINSHYPIEAKQYEFIVVVPRKGCHSCIQSAETIFKDKKNDPRFLFIFTLVDSPKKLKLEIGQENLSLDNVRIDTKELFYNANYYDSNYPLLLHKEKNGTFSYRKLVNF